MIEATIVDIGYGVDKTTKKALIGTRCSFSSVEDRRYMVGWKKASIEIVLLRRKNSRIRKERYQGVYLPVVRLADIVDDGYDLD